MKTRTIHLQKTETLYKGWSTLQAVTYQTEDERGTATDHRAEVFNAGDAVAILPYDAARRTVLLVRQARVAALCNGHPDGLLLEVPAGKIEDGLSPEATARKELLEETGYRIDALTPAGVPFMSPGSFTEKLYLFTAPYSPAARVGTGGGLANEGEATEVVELSFADALGRLRRGELADAKTILLLQHAALAGLLYA